MKIGKTIAAAASCIALLCVPAASFAQGSLTPPGSPAETMKTLEQVEPRTDVANLPGDADSEAVITDSGSYYMSSNLVVGKLKTYGIKINASDVTLDLNGFNIVGDTGDEGVRINGSRDRVTVRNGTVLGGDYGIRCYPSPTLPEGCLFEQLAVSGCTSYGIYAGISSRISDCRVHDSQGVGIYANNDCTLDGCSTQNTGDNGIFAGDGSTINACVASGSLGGNVVDAGISAGSGSTINGCTAKDNQSYGIIAGSGCTINECASYNNQKSGIYASDGATISECTLKNNMSHGIYARKGASISKCSAYNNDGYGIVGGDGSTISGCAAHSNQTSRGISGGDGSIIINCAAVHNVGMGSLGSGIYAGIGSAVIQCTARGNSHTNSTPDGHYGMGIDVGWQTTVKDCLVSDNQGDGIRVGYSSLVTGNTCHGNGKGNGNGAGIHATGSGNRIESNEVTVNDRGIDVGGEDNLIVRNSAWENTTNYDIAANNKVGLIVNPTDSAAIPGSSGGLGAAASGSPWVNFILEEGD